MFATDNELQEAKENGLCNKLTTVTINNLISAGYPPEAFSDTYLPFRDNIKFNDSTLDQANRIINMLPHKRVNISFTTQEDIDKKANGDYHLYFQ